MGNILFYVVATVLLVAVLWGATENQSLVRFIRTPYLRARRERLFSFFLVSLLAVALLLVLSEQLLGTEKLRELPESVLAICATLFVAAMTYFFLWLAND